MASNESSFTYIVELSDDEVREVIADGPAGSGSLFRFLSSRVNEAAQSANVEKQPDDIAVHSVSVKGKGGLSLSNKMVKFTVTMYDSFEFVNPYGDMADAEVDKAILHELRAEHA